MIRYNNSIVLKFDTIATGNSGAGLNVTVRVSDSPGKPLAQLFSDDNNPPTSLSNPTTSDDQGNYFFYVAEGVYDIIVNEGLPSEVSILAENINEGGVAVAEQENQTLTASQTDVVFTNVEIGVVEVSGPEIDDGPVLDSSVGGVGRRYSLLSPTSLRLDRTYPEGTTITATGSPSTVAENTYNRVSVTQYGAFDDPTRTIDQTGFFQTAATVAGSLGVVVVPPGDYLIDSNIGILTNWLLEPGAGIYGLPTLPFTNLTDTSRLTGQIIRGLTPLKSSVRIYGDPNLTLAKNRGLATTGTILALSEGDQPGVTGGVVASLQNGTGISGIGIQGLTDNDNTVDDVNLWASYFEGLARDGISGNTITAELNVTSKNTTLLQVGPNEQPPQDSGLTAGAWVSCGRGEVDDQNTSLGIGVLRATTADAKFRRGMVFFNNSLMSITADNGNFEEAIALGDEMAIVGYPNNASPNNFKPMTWIKSRDKSATGEGRLTFHAEDVNSASSCDYFTESTQFSPDDNQSNLGVGSRRWVQLYAYNASDIVSDRNKKTDETDFTQNEVDCFLEIGKLAKKWKWKAEKEEKQGTDKTVYWHCGPMAQDIWSKLEEYNLNPAEWGFINKDDDDNYSIIRDELNSVINAAIIQKVGL